MLDREMLTQAIDLAIREHEAKYPSLDTVRGDIYDVRASMQVSRPIGNRLAYEVLVELHANHFSVPHRYVYPVELLQGEEIAPWCLEHSRNQREG